MKITHLLAQYLYQTKKLDLQGIGSFSLDKSINIDTNEKNSPKEPGIEGILFVNNPLTIEDPELITFISKYTGKIKALAAADLNSHLELAKQFLNIGKPFLFEGIGSLSKIRSGEYSFVPGNLLTEKLTEQKIVGNRSTSTNEEPVSDYKSALYKKSPKTDWKKPVAFLFVIVGIALAIWGGYTVYKKTTSEKSTISNPETESDKILILEDSAKNVNDSLSTQPKTINLVESGATKFILEVSNKERAVQRYNKLKTYQWDVQMETTDSINYKLFLMIPVNAMETNHIIDSLTLLTGKKVYVER